MPDFYGTEAAANTYHADRGNVTWAAATSPNKLAALVRASAYIDSLGIDTRPCGAMLSRFPGRKTGGRAQAAAWPRTGATDIEGDAIAPDVVPLEVERATYEAALRELAAPGSLLPDFTPAQQVKREKVDVIDVEYAGSTAENPNAPVVSAVLQILAPVMVPACEPWALTV
jgi:hypothetical protein